MSFCTVVNCMDGRVQLPVIKYLQDHFGVEYVDSVTEPGPNAILAAGDDAGVSSIMKRISISVEKHGSVGIAVAAHHDCAGNPVEKDLQIDQVRKSLDVLKENYPGVETLGLWVDSDWQVSQI